MRRSEIYRRKRERIARTLCSQPECSLLSFIALAKSDTIITIITMYMYAEAIDCNIKTLTININTQRLYILIFYFVFGTRTHVHTSCQLKIDMNTKKKLLINRRVTKRTKSLKAIGIEWERMTRTYMIVSVL